MRQQILSLLQPYQGKKTLITSEQNATDIINEIKKGHALHANEYDRISSFFWAGTTKKTCKRIFDFLKQNVVYGIEPDTRQSVKSPAAIIATGQYKSGMNDCKHYSLFTAGILDSLRRKGKPIKWAFRFANYKLFQSTPHHVFVVCFDKSGEIWIDPVLSSFNEKKPYVNKKDVMALYRISGIGCPDRDCNCGVSTYRGGMDTIAGKAKRKARKAKKRALKAQGYCKGKAVKKIALAPARNAFLALVGLNVKKTAVKLHTKLQNPETKRRLFNKWCRLGGNAKKLENTINKAFRKYARKRKISGIEEMEVIGAPITALLAAAGPILVALKEFLGKAQEIKEGAQNLFSRGGGGGGIDQYEGPEEIQAEPEEVQGQGDEIGFMGMSVKDVAGIALIGFAAYKTLKN